MEKRHLEEGQLIPGIHATREALARGVRIYEIWAAEGRRGSRIEEILGMAQERGIPVRRKKESCLDQSLPHVAHQGVVALGQRFAYSDLGRLSAVASRDPGRALILAADHITDEGNLGALIRTAAFFGAHGLVIPKDRSAGVTERVLKRSSGACLYLPVVRASNLRSALDSLERKGFWVIGAAGEGSVSVYRFDWDRDVVLVIGREDRGLSPAVRGRCHELVAIPQKGSLDSLNLAVAAGVILSEITRQREEASLRRE